MTLTNFFTPKKLWVSAIAFLIVLYILFGLSMFFIGSDLDWFGLMILIFPPVISLLAGLIFGLLSALIPYRQQTFKQKFKVTFPFVTSLSSFVIAIAYIWLWIAAVTKYGPIRVYDSIEIPANLDCTSIHEGTFQSDFSTFGIKGDKEVEIQNGSDEIIEKYVEWISECEYYLTDIRNNNRKSKIKVIAVTKDGFDCYVTMGKLENLALYMRCKRIESNKNSSAAQN